MREDIDKRSKRMLLFFNSWKGKELKNFAKIAYVRWLNGTIINVERGFVELEFFIRPEMANPVNLFHGGIQCGLLDNAIGMAVATLGYEGFPISIDFHVDFIGKIKVEEKVKVQGKVINESRNFLHAIAEIYDMRGNLISTSNSKLLITDLTPIYVKEIDKNSNSENG
ncbi:MAG: PaaI family thioesterase [Candidatus Lokiarchaeota archaeon]|nr:PaaI family thioesterase [Candidatus Lokiarchaeota archaeon]